MTAFEDLSLLRAFVCIVESGNISAGARRLKIPQPTLSRYLRMIEEGCDAGVVAGDITDDSVIARPAGAIMRYLAASPALVKARPPVTEPANLKSWPWLVLSGARFGVSDKVTLSSPKKTDQTIPMKPVLVSEGVTSLREAARAGLGIAVLPDWLIHEDILSGRLIRVLPQWNAKELPCHVVYQGHRILPVRVRTFIDFAVAYMTTELSSKE